MINVIENAGNGDGITDQVPLGWQDKYLKYRNRTQITKESLIDT